jgi:Na+-transporting NADH:ubiquinone oxidoreductase subunit F
MQFMRKLHKWLGLIVGLQVILWAVSGVLFAWLDPGDVRAEASVRTIEPPVLAPASLQAEPTMWLGEYPQQELYDIRAVALADRWVWRVELQDRVELRAIEDGAPVKLDDAWVRKLALARYGASGSLATATLQISPDIESRSKGPVWRVQFDDPQRTALYFAADDGRLIAARNGSWRIYDFFWMLHTMDYVGRDNFNNPLIVSIGLAALWLTISGVVLLARSFGWTRATRNAA